MMCEDPDMPQLVANGGRHFFIVKLVQEGFVYRQNKGSAHVLQRCDGNDHVGIRSDLDLDVDLNAQLLFQQADDFCQLSRTTQRHEYGIEERGPGTEMAPSAFWSPGRSLHNLDNTPFS